MHAQSDIIEKVNESMPDEEILYDLAELFKIFGDSTRIKILYVLLNPNVRIRYISAFEYEYVRNIASAENFKTSAACKIQTRR